MKKSISLILAVIMAFVLFGCSAKEEAPTTTTTETTTQPPAVVNPLTGEEGYNKNAVDVRPVAIVVENAPAARPQWGLSTPDIIVEGEVEGGISRMLWLYADYTSVPEKIGPIRSARPSFVEFSELFDSIYIHWGGSHSKGDYIGGYGRIKRDDVDHIDGMDGGELFGRDTTRSVSSEHRGILKGKKLPSAIDKKGFRTEINSSDFTKLSFNDDVTNAGAQQAPKVNVKFSSRTDTRKFTFNSEDKMYHTSDWKDDVKFENILVLNDKTTYITTPYKGSTTTYLNYTLDSGDGYYISKGTMIPIKWSADGTLKITDEGSKEISLNQGRTYIALASSNNGGKITFE